MSCDTHQLLPQTPDTPTSLNRAPTREDDLPSEDLGLPPPPPILLRNHHQPLRASENPRKSLPHIQKGERKVKLKLK